MSDPRPSDQATTPDEADANAAHEADRPPTPEEEAAAPRDAKPAVSEAYEAAIERGAKVQGEGQIEP